MLRSGLAICVLGACGSAPVPTATTPTAGAAAGACPAADRVVFVRWMERVDDGTKLQPGWRAFLTNRHLDHDDGPTYAAGALAADAPRSIWIYPGEGAPCRATASAGFRLVTNVGPVSEQTGVELTGCPKPGTDQPEEVLGLPGDDSIAGCAFTPAEGVAVRSGDLGEDGVWAFSGGETPIPDQLAGLTDHRACTAPCVALWSVRAASADAYDVVQTWMKSTTGDACSLEHDDATSVLVRSGDRLTPLPADAVGNQGLVGVFRDGGGPRLVVLDDVGEYTVFSVGATPAPPVHRVWFDKNEEDANWRSLAPYCGP
jgi:hypothetical protein